MSQESRAEVEVVPGPVETMARGLKLKDLDDGIAGGGCFLFFLGIAVIWIAIVVKIARWAFS